MKIKIAFSDFWEGFDPEDNWFIRFLKNHFEIELSDHPDFLIYSVFGRKYLNYKCFRIFYTGENIRPNFFDCDFALSFDFNKRRNHYRLPLYGIWTGLHPEELLKPKPDVKEFCAEKPKFCCMLVSNPGCKKRNNFFQLLSKYRKVDSGGRFLNNTGFTVTDKMAFISEYKFMLCFENSSYPGYVTEKIYEPMFVNTIPVYWGSPCIDKDFNPESFVNCHHFKNENEVLEYIIKLDSDAEALSSVLAKPWFHHNEINPFIREENIVSFFNGVFSTEGRPVAETPKKYVASIINLPGRVENKLRRELRK